MKKEDTSPFVWIVIVLVIILIAVFVRLDRYPQEENTISAKVTNVTHRINQAEDGRYEITAETNDGQKYTIDATGYLNTPFTPESQGEACVDMPKVHVGDDVIFNLPKSKDQEDIFIICYDKNIPGYAYFFRIEKNSSL